MIEITDTRDRDLRRQHEDTRRDLGYDGHNRKPGAAKTDRVQLNRRRRRKSRQRAKQAGFR
jgi:hypothetical protein